MSQTTVVGKEKDGKRNIDPFTLDFPTVHHILDYWIGEKKYSFD